MKALKIIANVLLPIGAISRDLKSIKDNHANNWTYISSLYASIKKKLLSDNSANSLENLVTKQGKSNIISNCVFQKRMIMVALSFFIFNGISHINNGNMLGIITLLTTIPVALLFIYLTDYRIWQISNAKYEHTIIAYFRSSPTRIFKALNPLSSKGGNQ